MKPRAQKGEPAEFLAASIASNTDECIIWPYGKNPAGYGMYSYNGGTSRNVNNIICRMAYGDPPEDKPHSAHSCGVKDCVNPRHLSWKSPKENAQQVYEYNKGFFRKSDLLRYQEMKESKNMPPPVDFRDLIFQLGGPKAFGKKMGLSYIQAKGMSHRNVIAAKYWLEIMEVCQEEGRTDITPEWFFRLYSLKRGRWRRKPMQGQPEQ